MSPLRRALGGPGVRAAVLAIVIAGLLVGAGDARATVSGFFCGTPSNPVGLHSGRTCIHGTYHFNYGLVYGESTGTAYTRVGLSSSDSSEEAVPGTTSTCEWAHCQAYRGFIDSWPSGYAFVHNHSTFYSTFDAWLSANY